MDSIEQFEDNRARIEFMKFLPKRPKYRIFQRVRVIASRPISNVLVVHEKDEVGFQRLGDFAGETGTVVRVDSVFHPIRVTRGDQVLYHYRVKLDAGVTLRLVSEVEIKPLLTKWKRPRWNKSVEAEK
jgi:hypothetical protein